MPILELSPELVFYTGDSLRVSTVPGLAANWRFSRLWWLSTEAMVGSVALDKNSALGFEDGDFLLIANTGLTFNMPIRMGVESNSWRADFYTSTGPTWLRFGSTQHWGGYLGGGLTAYTPLSWLGLRADLKTYFYRLENPNGSDCNSDVSLTLGLSLFL